MTAEKARLLYNSGITTLDRLLVCDETKVVEALATGPATRKVSRGAEQAMRVGPTGAAGTNALVLREAKSLLQGTQKCK